MPIANKRRSRLASLLLFLILTAGCATVRPPDWQQQTAVDIHGIPNYRQQRLQCGAAALAMALTWSGRTITPGDLEDEVYTPERQGSLQFALVGAARRHGRAAYKIHGLDSLLHELQAGHPVLVLENLGLSWVPQWHYSLVVGIDPAADTVLLQAGLDRPEQRPIASFLHTWGRADFWGLLVLPPQQLPVSLTSQKIVADLAGLERVDPRAAAQAYQQVTQRWPNEPQGWLGLGNSLYATAQPERAAAAFDHACQADQPSAIACNNLAQVRLEQGRQAEARQAIQRAIELGGPFLSDFKDTLREIDSAR